MTQPNDTPTTNEPIAETTGGRRGISRRVFLRATGVGAATAAGLTALAGCRPDEAPPSQANRVHEPSGFRYDDVPPTPDHVLDTSRLHFFTTHEKEAVDALVSRMLPGTADDPGGVDAGVVGYIDLKLGTNDGGFATGAYMKPPFAKAYEGDTPPAHDDASTIHVKKSELERYGYQSKLNFREVFRMGLMALDAAATGTFAMPFASLPPAQQDQLIGQLADGTAAGFTDPSSKLFFATVRNHVIEGFLADPVYGGNRDMAGWRLVGYPGAQRAYSPEDIEGLTPRRPPQSLVQLHAFNPGMHGGAHAVLPVSGSRNGNEGSEHG